MTTERQWKPIRTYQDILFDFMKELPVSRSTVPVIATPSPLSLHRKSATRC